eukprot:scaffold8659_cov42-Cyclotella_meneghiniana.AAC.2
MREQATKKTEFDAVNLIVNKLAETGASRLRSHDRSLMAQEYVLYLLLHQVVLLWWIICPCANDSYGPWLLLLILELIIVYYFTQCAYCRRGQALMEKLDCFCFGGGVDVTLAGFWQKG